MKYLSFLILALPLSVFAQSRTALLDEKVKLENDLVALQATFDANEEEGKRLEQRTSDLEWTGQQLDSQIETLRVDSDAIDAEEATLDAAISNHNSQCGGEYEDENYVNWCNSNASSLNGQSATLSQKMNGWNARRDLLDEAVTTQYEQEVLVDTQIQQYLATYQQLVEAGQRIQARLAEIEAFNSNCEFQIAQYDAGRVPAEVMKAACGSMFDGN